MVTNLIKDSVDVMTIREGFKGSRRNILKLLTSNRTIVTFILITCFAQQYSKGN